MEDKHRHIVPAKTYIFVWASLLALTVITIAVAGLHLGKFSTLTAIVIASIKAGLVLWFFMHLKYEKPLFRLMLLVPLATLSVVIGLTFFDILFR